MIPDNNTSFKPSYYISLSILIALGIIINISARGDDGNNVKNYPPTNLGYLEIREYKGQDLSSINDFRENSISGPQYVDKKAYKLSIIGLVKNPKDYFYEDIINKFKHYTKVTTLNCVEGWSATVLWEGVRIMDLVNDASPSEDAEIIIFHAEDGYTTGLPVEYIRDNDLILAYKINEVILPEERGFPFQLVAESKWGYKWCRWVNGLEFSDDTDYEGYWERRGYSNTADLDDPFWGN